MASHRTLIRFLITALLASAMAHLASADEPVHTHTAAPPPADCPAAVARASDLTRTLDQALAASGGGNPNLPSAADTAFELAIIAKSLGRLALADDSIPREKVKPINLAGKSIAEAADSLHDALDANKLEPARTALATLKPLVASLAAALPPDPFVCEMRCEGKKSYDHPGTCPICKMSLIRQSRAPFAVQVSASSDQAASGGVIAGKPIPLDIHLLDQSADPVGPLEVVHEHPLHLIVVSEDLSFYAHEHPTRTPDGVFHLQAFTFPFGGRFIVFADFTPRGDKPVNRIARTEFTVPQGETQTHAPIALHENEDDIIKDGPYQILIRCNAGKFIARQDSFIRYGVDLDNQPVKDLQPLMGAMGHLVIISADTKKYIHAHPTTEPNSASIFTNGQPSDVTFHTNFPDPGLYRAFAQFQHNGRMILSAVTIDAKVPAEGAAPPTEPAHDHTHTHK